MKRTPITILVFISIVFVAGQAFGAGATFKLLAPAEEMFISQSRVLIIAVIEGETDAKRVEILDNGKTAGYAELKNNTMVFLATLSKGKHELVLAAPGVRRQPIRVFFGKQDDYSYHVELELDYCETCHSQASRGIYKGVFSQTELCAECHDPVDKGEFVHGPVAAGACTQCHDPHGSRNENFLVAAGRQLCLNCHSQNLSQNHIENRRNAYCIKCHAPHSSEKAYLLR
ncbi:MAG: cytochrome c3 family protein [bacterium]